MRVPFYCFKSLENTVISEPRRTQEITSHKREINRHPSCRQYLITAEKIFELLRLKLFQTGLNGNDADALNQSLLLKFMERPSSGTMREAPPWEDEKENTLSKQFQLHIAEVTSKRGRDTFIGIEKNLRRFMEVVGDKPVSQHTIEDRQKYRDVLQRIPQRINGARSKEMAIAEILQTSYPEDKRLSPTSVNHRLTDTAHQCGERGNYIRYAEKKLLKPLLQQLKRVAVLWAKIMLISFLSLFPTARNFC